MGFGKDKHSNEPGASQPATSVTAYLKGYLAKTPDLTGNKGIYAISLGEKEHEGEELSATCRLLPQLGLQEIHVLMADELQGFRYLSEEDVSVKANTDGIQSLVSTNNGTHIDWDDAMQQPRQRAKEDGDTWLDRNKASLDLLPSYTLIRWSEITQKPEFKDKLKFVEALYNGTADAKYEELSAKFKKSVNAYAGRVTSHLANCARTAGEPYSPAGLALLDYKKTKYFLEESAAVLLLPRAKYLLYPKSFHPRGMRYPHPIEMLMGAFLTSPEALNGPQIPLTVMFSRNVKYDLKKEQKQHRNHKEEDKDSFSTQEALSRRNSNEMLDSSGSDGWDTVSSEEGKSDGSGPNAEEKLKQDDFLQQGAALLKAGRIHPEAFWLGAEALCNNQTARPSPAKKKDEAQEKRSDSQATATRARLVLQYLQPRSAHHKRRAHAPKITLVKQDKHSKSTA